jgi:hypothetical protein
MYLEVVNCLHFEGNGGGLVFVLEGYADETEEFGKKVWKETYRKGVFKETKPVLKLSSVRQFSYGIGGGKSVPDFNCSPEKEDDKVGKLFRREEKSWLEKLKVPEGTDVVISDKVIDLHILC